MNKRWDSFINSQSVKVRFLASLLVNIARLGLGFLGGIVIARSLGPAGYGNYSFLLGSFVSFAALLDMGTSSAFYTFLSQRKRSLKFYLYYFLWLGIQFLIVMLFIGVIFPDVWRNKIWLGHPKGIIALAFLASFMMDKVWLAVARAGESIRATVTVQLFNIIIASIYLCIVLLLSFLRILTIPSLFITIIVLYFSLSLMLAKQLKHSLIIKEEAKILDVFNEFKTYCLPLIIYGVVTAVYLFADVWLLQNFGGAVQQGFYSVGMRFSAICLVATTSMLNVFWKEIAEANELGNKERLYQLYMKISKGIYFAGAVGACFLIPFSREILDFFLGPKYEMGWLCLAVMFLYPIHQSLGQINNIYFFATAQTKLNAKINIITMLASMPITYFILAPSSGIIPGLNLGSVGLAIKKVIFQMISVNVLSYFICKLSQWKFNFLYQFESIAILVIISFAIKWLLIRLLDILNIYFHPLLLMIPYAFVYCIAVGMIVYLLPRLSGLERKQVVNFVRVFTKFPTYHER